MERKFWVVLIVAFSILALSTTASAVDVKFSGSYYAAGMYEDNHGLLENDQQSTAFYFQRLRVQTVFEIDKGLTLTTRFDALEKVWGDTNWNGTRSNVSGRPHTGGSSKTLEQENIEFENAYLTYQSPIGTFLVGYLPHDTQWGTIWGTSERAESMIWWRYPIGKFSVGIKIIKGTEKSKTAFNDPSYEDADKNVYSGTIRYKGDDFETGLKWTYLDKKDTKPAPTSFKVQNHLVTPYFLWRAGNFKLETELEYLFGDAQDFEDGRKDTDIKTLSWYVNAEMTEGPFYFGATAAYSSGDDPDTSKVEGASVGMYSCWGGLDYDPALILWNEDRNVWIGPLQGNGSAKTAVGSGVINAYLFLGYVGYHPTSDWDLKATLLYATADEKPTLDGKPSSLSNPKFVDDEYGYEFDITATYKITNNLSYMAGAGYLWTGDYFKGTDKHAEVDDDYMLTHKLTLTF